MTVRNKLEFCNSLFEKRKSCQRWAGRKHNTFPSHDTVTTLADHVPICSRYLNISLGITWTLLCSVFFCEFTPTKVFHTRPRSLCACLVLMPLVSQWFVYQDELSGWANSAESVLETINLFTPGIPLRLLGFACAIGLQRYLQSCEVNELSLDSSTSQQGLLNEVWIVLKTSHRQVKDSGVWFICWNTALQSWTLSSALSAQQLWLDYEWAAAGHCRVGSAGDALFACWLVVWNCSCLRRH